MNLELLRFALLRDATLGVLSVDGAPRWFTLEDPDRLFASLPKIPGRTAIPTGTYRVRRKAWSPRFRRALPEVVDVPGFTDILIHAGNTPAHTEGCLLVGTRAEIVPAFIGSSLKALEQLCSLVFAAPSEVRLTITRATTTTSQIDALRTFWTGEQLEA